MQKHGLKKSSKNDGPGIHFGSQNRWKWTLEGPKNAQIAKKCRFLKVPFFDRFFDTFFSWILGVPGVSGGLPKSRFPPLFSSCLRAWVFKAILSRFWVDSGSILNRFWLHFGSLFGRFRRGFWIDFWSIRSPLLNWFRVALLWRVLPWTPLMRRKLWLGRPRKSSMNEWMKLY